MASSYLRERSGNRYLRARNPYRRLDPTAYDIGYEDPGVSSTFERPMSPAITSPPPLEVIEPRPEVGARRAVSPIPAADSLDAAREIELARAAYEAKAPTTTGGKILEVLKTAGLGFLQGAARDPNNPIAAGLGGAAAGGLISGINPQAGRSYRFETIQRPGLEDKLRREEAQRQRQRQIEADELKRQEILSSINLQRSQAEKNRRPETPRAINPYRRVEGGILNQTTGELTPIAETPKAPSPAWRETYTGRVFDISDPAQRAEYDRIQSHGPRDKFGRFVSRADERASAPKASKPKEAPKYVSRSQIIKYAQENNMSSSDAAAIFKNKGYRVTN